MRRERGVGDVTGPARGAAILSARAAAPALRRARRPATTPVHDEAAQRVPAELHPLAGLDAHDADGPALRGRWPQLRVGARLLLDAPRHRPPDEQDMSGTIRGATFSAYLRGLIEFSCPKVQLP